MLNYPIHLLQEIIDFCDLHSIFNFLRTNKKHSVLLVKNLYDISKEIKDELTQEILQQPKYIKLLQLNLKNNMKHFDLNHLIYLQKLNIGFDCLDFNYFQISDEEIKNCKNLTCLLVQQNKKIKNVNYFINLEILDASLSHINNQGIKNCKNIKKLHTSPFITDTNHLIQLEELYAININLGNEGIKECKKLKKLYINCNENITDINHLINLEELSVVRNLKINNNGLKNCINIKRLDMGGSNNITDLNTLINLESLINEGSFLTKKAIKNCKKLKMIYIDGFGKKNNHTHLENIKKKYKEYYFLSTGEKYIDEDEDKEYIENYEQDGIDVKEYFNICDSSWRE
jgi:hypothetical protein